MSIEESVNEPVTARAAAPAAPRPPDPEAGRKRMIESNLRLVVKIRLRDYADRWKKRV